MEGRWYRIGSQQLGPRRRVESRAFWVNHLVIVLNVVDRGAFAVFPRSTTLAQCIVAHRPSRCRQFGLADFPGGY